MTYKSKWRVGPIDSDEKITTVAISDDESPDDCLYATDRADAIGLAIKIIAAMPVSDHPGRSIVPFTDRITGRMIRLNLQHESDKDLSLDDAERLGLALIRTVANLRRHR